MDDCSPKRMLFYDTCFVQKIVTEHHSSEPEKYLRSKIMAVFGSTGTSLGTYSSSSNNTSKTNGLWRSNGSSSASKANARSRTGSTCPTCGKSSASAYYTGTTKTNATCTTCGKTAKPPASSSCPGCSQSASSSGRASYVGAAYLK